MRDAESLRIACEKSCGKPEAMAFLPHSLRPDGGFAVTERRQTRRRQNAVLCGKYS
jgi:hypothetical protein